MGPTQLFSCEYCKIFKNSYFEEHPRRAASEVRINPKLNLRKQVFFKTDVSQIFIKSHRMTPVLECLFNEVTRSETTNTKA